MKKEDLRIVYMGTPDFAVESLRALVEGGYNIVGVITMPDKPVGRPSSSTTGRFQAFVSSKIRMICSIGVPTWILAGAETMNLET